MKTHNYFLFFLFAGIILFSLNHLNPIQAQVGLSQSKLFINDGDSRLISLVKSEETPTYTMVGKNGNNIIIDSDWWVVQVSEGADSLETEWEFVFECPGLNDTPEKIIVNSGGDFLIAGSIDSAATFPGIESAAKDAMVIKLSDSGQLLWAKIFGGAEDDVFKDIIETTDGGYLLTGYSASTDFEGLNNYGDKDAWIVKLDANGNLLWQKNYGSSEEDEAFRLLATNDGNYVMVAYVRTADQDVSTSIGSKDIWLAKLDPEGNLLWEQSHGGELAETPSDALLLSDGKIVIVGETNSEWSTGYGQVDVWVLICDTAGNLLQERAFGGTSFETPKSMLLNSSGNLVLLSETFSVNGDINNSYLALDVWYLEVNLDLDIVYSRVFGGNQFESAFDLIESNENSYLGVGYTDSNDGDLAQKHGLHNAWAFHLTPEDTSTALYEMPMNSLESIGLYPNPSQGMVYFPDLVNQGSFQLNVYDMSGKLCLQRMTNHQPSISLSQLENGYYWIELKDGEKRYWDKILLMR